MSAPTIEAGQAGVERAWVLRAVLVVALAALITAGVVIRLAATGSHRGPTTSRPSTAVSTPGQPAVPVRPGTQGYLHLPKGMDGP
jgi:hypothetical protein